MMHQVSRTTSSITLSWPQPDQPNGIILDYQLRYFDKVSVGKKEGIAAIQGEHGAEKGKPL